MNTRMSKAMLLAPWAAKVANRTSGALLPHPTHFPGRVNSQFFLTGLQENRAKRKKDRLQQDTRTIMVQISVRAVRFCISKRRRYWTRMESLIRPVPAVYAVFEDHTCCIQCELQIHLDHCERPSYFEKLLYLNIVEGPEVLAHASVGYLGYVSARVRCYTSVWNLHKQVTIPPPVIAILGIH